MYRVHTEVKRGNQLVDAFDTPLFGSETASTLTTCGVYDDDRTHAWVSSYNLTDGSWQPVAARPFMTGSFAWTGFDYKGEPTPY